MKHQIFSPYRVCPVGAHVDHQHGLVTGFALDKGITLDYDVTDNAIVTLRSEDFIGEILIDLSTDTTVKRGDWGDYARGAKYALRKRFLLKKGINGILKGSMPIGGLSSSAAVLVAYVMAFARANSIELKPLEVAKIASEAEREYIGLNNGLLDQTCIVLGKANQLLMLDCDTNDYRLIAKNENLPNFKLGVFFSGLTRSLVNSDYNLRVQECRTTAWIMQSYDNQNLKPMEKTFLRDVHRSRFDELKEKMPERFARRATHFYTEYARVREAVTAWEIGDLNWIGRLMNESCASSIYNYECGSPELITLHNILKSTDGVYGSRFSGAGFKGACVAIINAEKENEVVATVTEKYLKEFPQYKNTFQTFLCNSGDGARWTENK